MPTQRPQQDSLQPDGEAIVDSGSIALTPDEEDRCE
jgi:hypothetical protein